MPKKTLQPWAETWLKENHHLHSIHEMCEHIRISHSYICVLLNRWGLKKTEEQHKAVLLKCLHKVGEPRVFKGPDNHGNEQMFINFGGNNTQRYSHYLLAQSGTPVNNRRDSVVFLDGNNLNCVLENIKVFGRTDAQWVRQRISEGATWDEIKNERRPVIKTGRRPNPNPTIKTRPIKEKVFVTPKRELERAKKREERKEQKRIQGLKREASAKRLAQEKKDKATERNWQKQTKKKEPRQIVLPNMANLVPVKIDRRTTIYIRPDQDPEEEIKKYHLKRA